MKYLLCLLLTITYTPYANAQPNACEELVISIQTKRSDQVSDLLKSTNPNCSCKCEEDPRTPLATAVYYGQLDLVKLLIRNGAMVSYRDKRDASALIIAAERGYPAIVKYLIDNGANVNQKIADNGTPLIAAVKGDHYQIVRLLLEAGANPNVGTPDDGSPILQVKSVELLKLLLDYDIDVNKRSLRDGTALIRASVSGNEALVKALIMVGADVNKSSDGDGNPLIMAAKNGHLSVVKLLVDAGADVNAYVAGDETPLISAAWSGHLEVVKFLTENGADVNKSVRDGYYINSEVRSPLKMARKGGHQAVTDYLISQGAKEYERNVKSRKL
ncbi:MAG: ankyrin repeat domain-containing protein [Bacteroidota bacterium]